MCGICGLTSLSGAPLPPSDAVIRRMNGILTHRGPDEEGYHLAPDVHLGVRRLRILDLEGGSQPIYNEDRSVAIVFNGEIYNFRELRAELQAAGHRFTTRTDTEVIVHLYEERGPECLQKLNGDFAFALWDARQRRLFLSRDRVGMKPLFYATTGGSLVFASEIKSLLVHPAVGREVDHKGLDQLFTFFMPVNPRTLFKGIRNLPPGRWIDVEGGRVQVRKYWQPRFGAAPQNGHASDAHWAERLRAELERSVRYRMVSDVPLGVFVSGGIDSCVVAHLVSRLSGRPIRTYSICHEDTYYDESPYSDLMARALGSEHHRLVVSPRQIAESLPALVWRVEAPSCKTSNAAYMRLYQLARETSTVILTGEGADEALGGYPNIRLQKVLDFCRRHPRLPGAAKLMEKVLPPGSTAKVMYYEPEALPEDEEARVRELFGCIPVDLQRYRSLAGAKVELLSADTRAALDGYRAEAEMACELVDQDVVRGLDFMEQAQYFEYLLKLPNYLLINPGDRAAMTHSVENRCPFVDPNLIEFCLALPPTQKVRGLTEKYVLRQAFARELPEPILRRSKRPFTTFYVSSIFRESRPEFLDDILSEAAVRRAGLFTYPGVRDLKCRLEDPRLTVEEQVKLEIPFSLVVTAQLWHQMFIEDFRSEGPSLPAAWSH